MRGKNLYSRIIESIFIEKYSEGDTVVAFEREDIVRTAAALGLKLPKNLGDVVYSFKYRSDLPASVIAKAPQGLQWTIVPKGRSRYAFEAKALTTIVPDGMLTYTKVPDATPGLVGMYALGDEQALLAKLRYNRLIDIFTGVTTYSLQNHLRTTVPNMGQVETDELYVGVDKRGAHYVFPVQAKGGTDALAVVQVEQDIALCEHKFPGLICRPIAAQFMADDLIALFELETVDGEIRKVAERHYKLVDADEIDPEEIRRYAERPEGI